LLRYFTQEAGAGARHTEKDMLRLILEAALRSLLLADAVRLLLKLVRIRNVYAAACQGEPNPALALYLQ
jgi:hypothetical protein